MLTTILIITIIKIIMITTIIVMIVVMLILLVIMIMRIMKLIASKRRIYMFTIPFTCLFVPIVIKFVAQTHI